MGNYFPPGTHVVQLRGRYVDPQGLPLSGTVSFTPPPTVVLKDSDLIVARTTTATLDDQGGFVVWLLATDSPNMSPMSWAYQVTEKLTAPTPQVPPFIPPPPPTRTFYILLPSFPEIVDLADLAPAQPYTVAYLPVAGPPGPTGPGSTVPGPPGPQGPMGPQGPAGEVTQSEFSAAMAARPVPVTFSQVSAASTWTIAHAFPYQPDVTVFDTSDREMAGLVSYPTLSSVTVQFAAPETGTAVLR